MATSPAIGLKFYHEIEDIFWFVLVSMAKKDSKN